MANQINVGMDVSQLKTAAEEMQKALQGAASATQSVATESVAFNAKLKATQIVVKALGEDGSVLTAKFKETATGLQLLGVNAKAASSELNRIKDATKAAAEEAKRYSDALQKSIDAARRAQSEANKTESARNKQAISNNNGGSGGGSGGSGGSSDGGEKLSISVAGLVRLFETQVIRQGFRAIITGFQQAVVEAEKFSIAVARIETITQGSGISTGKWNKELVALSNQFGNNQTEIAQAAYIALQSQLVKGADATKLLGTALKLGSVVNLDATESTRLLTTTLNAFKIPADEAEKVAGSLFSAVANGSVNAKDLASNFGRLASTAGGTGIKLEEIVAALDVLTTKGLKFGDATGLLNNLLSQTIKPSKELAKSFLDMGASSGEVFIQMKGGLGGFLQFLDKEAESGNQRLAELTSSFKTIRGSLNLTGPAFTDFNASLEKTKNGTALLNNGFDIVNKSIGQQFKLELNKVKTFFTDEFGASLINDVISISKYIGGEEGMVGAVKKLLGIVKEAATVFLAFKAAMLAKAVYTAAVAGYGALSLAIRSYTVGLVAAENAQHKLNIATAANIIGAAALLSYGAYQLARSQEDPDDRTNATDIRSRGVAQEDRRQSGESSSSKKQREDEAAGVKAVTDANAAKYRSILNYTSNVVKASESLKSRAVDNLKDITDQVKITGSIYSEALSKGLAKMQKDSNEFDSSIRRSKKLLEDLDRSSEQRVFRVNQKFAASAENDGRGNIAPNRFIGGQNVGADQSITLAQDRADKLLEEAKTKFKEGSKESVDEARKLFKEVEALQEQIFTKGVANQRAALDAAVKNGYSPTRINQPQDNRDKGTQIIDGNKPYPDKGGLQSSQVQKRITPDGQVRYDLLVKTADLEKQIGAIKQEQRSLEENFQKQQAKKIEEKAKEIEQEKVRIKTIQQGLQELAKFSVLDKDGQVKKEYKDNPKKAGTEYQGIVDKITNASKPDEQKTQLQFFTDLYKQREAIVTQVEVSIRAEQAKTIQQYTTQLAKTKESQNAETAKTLADNQKVIDSQLKIIAGAQELVKVKGNSTGRQYQAADTIEGALRRGNPFDISRDAIHKEDASVEGAETKRQEAIKKLYEYIEAKTKFINDKTLENAEALAKAARSSEAATTSYIQKRTGKNTDEVTLPGDTSGKTAKDVLKGSSDAAEKIVDSFSAVEKAKASLKAIEADTIRLQTSMDKIPDSLLKFAPAAATGGSAVKKSLEDMKSDADSLLKKLDEINERLSTLKVDIPQSRQNRDTSDSPSGNDGGGAGFDAAGKMFGGKPTYFSSGGGVDFKPRGSDRIPAMLAKDEFVVNAQAAQQFRPQLEAINNFQQPRYMASGGSVTNVGDINVNVNGGDTSARTVRDIATGLRRELRRGTVTLQ